MTNSIDHEIELYLLEVFNTLFDHEVRTARRYKHPLSLIHIAICAEPDTEQTQHAAEMVAINALDAELRDSDIPCRHGHDFLVLLPSTDQSGALNACERLEQSLNISDQTHDGIPFHVSAYIGLASSHADSGASKAQLKQEASQAMQHARATHSLTTVLYSDVQ